MTGNGMDYQLTPGRRGGFGRSVGAKLTATALWKGAVVVLTVLVLGGGAITAVVIHREHQAAAVPSTGVALKKIVGIKEFAGAKAEYTFNFTDQLHHSFLFFTGENIQVKGSGTDYATVTLTHAVVTRAGVTGALIVLPPARLGTPQVDLGQTTLSESAGLFTRMSHMFESDPDGGKEALADAQARIAAAAAHSSLVSTTEASLQSFLTGLLRKLGFTRVTVEFL
jgi:hypothetical protein